jgi:hypothetical protein
VVSLASTRPKGQGELLARAAIVSMSTSFLWSTFFLAAAENALNKRSRSFDTQSKDASAGL